MLYLILVFLMHCEDGQGLPQEGGNRRGASPDASLFLAWCRLPLQVMAMSESDMPMHYKLKAQHCHDRVSQHRRGHSPDASLFLAWCRPPLQLMAMSESPWFSLTAPSMLPPA